MTREIATRTRRDLASWQKAALGLLALSVGANTLLYGAILSRDKKIDNLETQYQAVKAIQRDAVAAYGKLVAQVDAEEQETVRWCQRSVVQLLEQVMKTHVFDATQECRVSQLLFDLVVGNSECVGCRQCRNRRSESRAWRCCAAWRGITRVSTRSWSRSSAG